MKTNGTTEDAETKSKIDRQRYSVVRKFFIRSFLHLIFWDIILNRPVLRWLRKNPVQRWQKISRSYRDLAIEMGGVLIKLGQFLAVRVDILPREVTSELTGLLDEIPAEKSAANIYQIEEDFNRPIAELFEWFSPVPLGAASLGQVHPARLAKDHTDVVVKVLRPGIDIIVETDLAAISQAIGWLKRYQRVSRRVDLDWLIEEFSRVTRAELDFAAEGKNAERFAHDFVDDPGVYFPRIFWDYCAAHTLTMENVGYIKVSDQQAIGLTGINQEDVSKKIYNIYLRQIFETHFIHADPHPGNIFIKPMPTEAELEQGLTEFSPGEVVEHQTDRPFQVVFVDFGMVTVIPSRLKSALKEYAIGIATRDAFRIVQSYVQAGTLLPGADLKRLEEAHQALLNRFWGANALQMKDVVLAEAESLIQEYRDVIYNAPFQFQADMLFAIRAVAILSGISTDLNEKFDPWQEIIPFAERLASRELRLNWQEWLKEIVTLGQIIYRLPKSVDAVISQAQRGNLTLKSSFAPESRRLLVGLERSINKLSWTIASVGLLIAGFNLKNDNSWNWLSIILVAMSIFFFGWAILGNRHR
jgi:predicted unusual protein kinase regulating ubiquinone biosynthesis (AarF/ABC1/UbiB family)